MIQPHDSGYVPTSSDYSDEPYISASASITTCDMTKADKDKAARHKKKRDAAGGFGFGRAAHGHDD